MSHNMLPHYQSLALFTDLYQLTMGYGYWKLGNAGQEAIFTLNIRDNPFEGGYTVCAGLGPMIEALKNFRFEEDDITYLASLRGQDEIPLFPQDYLDYLGQLELTCDIDAVPEGTVVFPHEPLVRVQGPILECQILETLLLNIINFSSLIATKASRICWAAKGEPVLEFGARRAQGIDGGLSASRAAYIGGCTGTSNLLAGKYYGIPVKGTHAHSWVMSFDSEAEAFQEYADCMPQNCVFLVDTYNTVEGVRQAIIVAQKMKKKGQKPIGIRLDSGDLAYLSIIARKMLDKAGLQEMSIVGSNDLDEFIIRSLKGQKCKVTVWGVGTNLVTAAGQSALGGVYKMTAIKKEGQWFPKIKLSEQSVKINTPGKLQLRRFFRKNGMVIADAIYDEHQLNEKPSWKIFDPKDPLRSRKIQNYHHYQDLLVPILRQGKVVYDTPDVHSVRSYSLEQKEKFHAGVKRFVHPHSYPAGLEESLHQKKVDLITQLRDASLQT
ncbi:MAG: nicotinate phosphoribosyltransferase [SAR324 cluster bacterium]|uniref:Nicotinate phosphoribosyltransferase n=1 Tax=SAR324 cluster bacterium TaxID=2024889 RepID=A0A2A4T9A0_9DELT|nr:MAG: nicotinate phosphoribosyltransferase [SAR324 cluster bacterium]